MQTTATADASTAEIVPVTIIDPTANNQLEIELASACVVRLKGTIDPAMLQAAIMATGQLDGFHRRVWS